MVYSIFSQLAFIFLLSSFSHALKCYEYVNDTKQELKECEQEATGCLLEDKWIKHFNKYVRSGGCDQCHPSRCARRGARGWDPIRCCCAEDGCNDFQNPGASTGLLKCNWYFNSTEKPLDAMLCIAATEMCYYEEATSLLNGAVRSQYSHCPLKSECVGWQTDNRCIDRTMPDPDVQGQLLHKVGCCCDDQKDCDQPAKLHAKFTNFHLPTCILNETDNLGIYAPVSGRCSSSSDVCWYQKRSPIAAVANNEFVEQYGCISRTSDICAQVPLGHCRANLTIGERVVDCCCADDDCNVPVFLLTEIARAEKSTPSHSSANEQQQTQSHGYWIFFFAIACTLTIAFFLYRRRQKVIEFVRF